MHHWANCAKACIAVSGAPPRQQQAPLSRRGFRILPPPSPRLDRALGHSRPRNPSWCTCGAVSRKGNAEGQTNVGERARSGDEKGTDSGHGWPPFRWPSVCYLHVQGSATLNASLRCTKREGWRSREGSTRATSGLRRTDGWTDGRWTHACRHACTHARTHARTQARRQAFTYARIHTRDALSSCRFAGESLRTQLPVAVVVPRAPLLGRCRPDRRRPRRLRGHGRYRPVISGALVQRRLVITAPYPLAGWNAAARNLPLAPRVVHAARLDTARHERASERDASSGLPGVVKEPFLCSRRCHPDNRVSSFLPQPADWLPRDGKGPKGEKGRGQVSGLGEPSCLLRALRLLIFGNKSCSPTTAVRTLSRCAISDTATSRTVASTLHELSRPGIHGKRTNERTNERTNVRTNEATNAVVERTERDGQNASGK